MSALDLTPGEVAALVAHLRETRPRTTPYSFTDVPCFPTLRTADLLTALEKLERTAALPVYPDPATVRVS